MNKLDSIKRKIKYRAGYRGIKEMDLLLTAFVEKYIDYLIKYSQDDFITKFVSLHEDEITKYNNAWINPHAIKVKLSPCQKPLIIKIMKI